MAHSRIWAFIGLGFALSAGGHANTASGASTAKAASVPPFHKVVVVLFENENIDKPLSQPFFSKLAKEGALLRNYHAITHPSLPNYLALTSADTFGIVDDDNHDLDARNLADLLEAKGKTWKNYAEDFPGHCFKGRRQGAYVRKHTPFLSYKNISTTKRCQNIVEASEFARDVKHGHLPDFSFFTPNLDNDVHDTDIAYGDRWFAKTFRPLLAEPALRDALLVVTFDENECVWHPKRSEKAVDCHTDSNQVYTVFYGPGVKSGTISDRAYDHFSLLKTIEAGFGLESLGKRDQSATLITDVWR